MINNELLIKYFLDKAKTLSLEYAEQEKLSFELGLGDYFTEDMANEWFIEDIKDLDELVNKDLISKKAIELYSIIDNNFSEVSANGKLYEKGIWTLNALKNHVFWEKQRNLARQFIKELLKK